MTPKRVLIINCESSSSIILETCLRAILKGVKITTCDLVSKEIITSNKIDCIVDAGIIGYDVLTNESAILTKLKNGTRLKRMNLFRLGVKRLIWIANPYLHNFYNTPRKMYEECYRKLYTVNEGTRFHSMTDCISIRINIGHTSNANFIYCDNKQPVAASDDLHFYRTEIRYLATCIKYCMEEKQEFLNMANYEVMQNFEVDCTTKIPEQLTTFQKTLDKRNFKDNGDSVTIIDMLYREEFLSNYTPKNRYTFHSIQ
jgi:hypothetical protein